MHKCLECGSDKTYISKRKYPRENWYKYKDGYLCMKCHSRSYCKKWRSNNTDRIKKYHDIYDNKKMRFKGKSITLKDNPRTGVCSLCRFKGLTHMHHINYHESDPLKDTIELCASCHAKQHI